MERLTRRSKVGEGLPVKHLNLRHEDTTSEGSLTEILDKLASYEDTGLTPEDAKDLCDLHSNVLKFFTDRQKLNNKYHTLLECFDRKQKECDYWEREAKKWCNELGKIREDAAKELCD